MKRWITLTVALLVSLTCSPVSYAGEVKDIYYYKVTNYYTCMYNKPGEKGGLDYWVNNIASQYEIPTAIAFVNSVEILEGAVMTNTEFITRLYNMALNRDPDPGGFDYWMERLSHVPKGTLMLEFIAGIFGSPTSAERSCFINKMYVGVYYGWIKGYTEICPINYYEELGVTDDPASIRTAVEQF